MTIRHMRAVALALYLVTLGLLAPDVADALECPAPSPRLGMIPETAAGQTELEAALTNGNVANQVAVRVPDLRRRYPDVSDAELMNIFMMAYCPAVVRLSGLSDTEKQGRLDQFSAEISPMIYQGK